MEVRITNDGQSTSLLPRVLSVETGEELHSVTAVDIHFRHNDKFRITTAAIELVCPEINVLCEGKLYTVLSNGKRYRLVEL